MGVFVPAFNLQELDLGIFTLSSAQQLFLLGGMAIAAGILTYSNRIMEVVGGSIMELSSESALVVVLAQSLVLFIFSSASFSSLFVRIGFPPIPMVPVSSTQVIIGSVIGIGLYKGARNINFRILRDIATGWLATPLSSCILAYVSLFFVKNIFSIDVGRKTEYTGDSVILQTQSAQADPRITDIMQYLILGLLITGILVVIFYYFLERKKRNELHKSEEKFWRNIKST
jgi:PiT family inorganic phosphate transporter